MGTCGLKVSKTEQILKAWFTMRSNNVGYGNAGLCHRVRYRFLAHHAADVLDFLTRTVEPRIPHVYPAMPGLPGLAIHDPDVRVDDAGSGWHPRPGLAMAGPGSHYRPGQPRRRRLQQSGPAARRCSWLHGRLRYRTVLGLAVGDDRRLPKLRQPLKPRPNNLLPSRPQVGPLARLTPKQRKSH
jgi:hypothetical protein